MRSEVCEPGEQLHGVTVQYFTPWKYNIRQTLIYHSLELIESQRRLSENTANSACCKSNALGSICYIPG